MANLRLKPHFGAQGPPGLLLLSTHCCSLSKRPGLPPRHLTLRAPLCTQDLAHAVPSSRRSPLPLHWANLSTLSPSYMSPLALTLGPVSLWLGRTAPRGEINGIRMSVSLSATRLPRLFLPLGTCSVSGPWEAVC